MIPILIVALSCFAMAAVCLGLWLTQHHLEPLKREKEQRARMVSLDKEDKIMVAGIEAAEREKAKHLAWSCSGFSPLF